MSKEKQIEEMLEMAEIVKQADMSNNATGHNTDYKQFSDEAIIRYGCGRLNGVSMLYSASYRKQSEGELRVETITDDFTDMKIAEERGWYRKRFYCPNCDLLIKTESWDRNYMFGCGTVLKSNDMPKFCPNCGAKMKGGAE